MYYVVFCVWFLLFNNVSIKFIYIVACFSLLITVVYSIALYKYTTLYSFC